MRRRFTTILSSALFSLLLTMIFLLQGLELYNFYMQGESFNFAFYSTMLDVPLIMEMLPNQINTLILGISCVLCNVIIFIVFALFGKWDRRNQKKWIITTGVAVLLSFLIPFTGETAPVNFFKMIKYANLRPDLETASEIDLDPEYFRKFGISVCPTTKKTLRVYDKGTQKNLVLIILESMEKQFMDEDRFPGLTPNLNRLKNDGGTIWFDQMHSFANNTAESMIETFWGMPSFPTFSSAGGTGGFNKKLLDAFVSMPYIFTKSGYTWYHIQTPPLSDMRQALAAEKIYTGFADELNLTPDFGKRDHHVFDYAWRMFEKRISKNKPLVLSVSTIDAHTPNGFVDPQTMSYPNKNAFPKKYANFQLLDAIHNCDHHLGIFIDRILRSPVGKNTVIAIMNDHLFMGNADGRLNGHRACVFMIANSGKRISIEEFGYQMDIPPTLLDFFGIKSNYIFPVGVSLLTTTDKNYKTRTKCISNNRLELCKYAKAKSIQKQNNTEKIFFDRNTDNIFNIFGTEIPVPDSRNLMIIKLNEQRDVISASFPRLRHHLLTEAIESHNEAVFIFHGNSDRLTRDLCKRLNIISYPSAYGLIFKDNSGRFSAVLSLSKNDLSIDTKYIVNSKINLRDLYPKIKKHGKTTMYNEYLNFKNCQVTKLDNHISASGIYSFITLSCCFPVSDSGEISFSTRLKNIGTTPVKCYLGFVLYDKNFRSLDGKNYPYESEDRVFAAVQAKKGSDVITVSGSPRASKNCWIARNADPDGTDIPNHDLLAQRVVSVRECGNGHAEIRLSKPLNQDIPVGEKLRIHGQGGGYFYKAVKVLPCGHAESFDFSAKKDDRVMKYTHKNFPRGVCFIRPLIMSFSQNKNEKNTIEIHDAALTW